MLDSRLLRSFVVLADELHFARAADRLMIARSALSAQIARLEDQVGSRLFERNRRAAVSLTRPGRSFLVEARRALDSLDHARRIGRAAARLEAGAIRMGYVFTAGINGMLAHALRSLHGQRPLLDITPVPLETPEQIAAIAEGTLDLGLIRPRDTYPANLRVRVVHREPLLLLHGADHPLAGLPHLHRHDLRCQRFIIPQLGERTGLSKAVYDLAGSEPDRPDPASTSDFVSAVNMAAAGLGVVLAPRSVGGLQIAGIRARPIMDYAGAIEMALAWRDGDVSAIADLLPTWAGAAEPID